MKIQNLAVIFIIIILPISMIVTAYVKNQVETLELQVSYDTKLTNATYDALKAFQLNTVNSSTSDLANSKLRDIEASVNTFFNSIATNFNMAGYNQDILKQYVDESRIRYIDFKSYFTINIDGVFRFWICRLSLKPYSKRIGIPVNCYGNCEWIKLEGIEDIRKYQDKLKMGLDVALAAYENDRNRNNIK